MVQFLKGRAIALAMVLELFFAIALLGTGGACGSGGHGTCVDYRGGSAWEMLLT